MKDEIKVLPKNKYKELFGITPVKLREITPLEDSELFALKEIYDKNPKTNIYRVLEVDKPQGVRTPDFLVGGIKTEVKTITSKRSIERQIISAKGQIGDDGVLWIDASNSELKNNEIINEVKRKALSKQIKGFVVAKNDSVINAQILNKSKTDYSSATYTHSEGSLFHNSIISQKHEKINIISPEFRNEPPNYWQKRSLQRTVAAERQALPYIRKLREEYARSSNRSIDNVRRIYENYFSKAGFDRQKLREIVPSGELSKYLKEVRKLGIELPDNYKYRVSREEFAQAQLWLEAKKLGVFENQISTELYSKIINQSFTQTFGDYGVNFAKLNTESMNQILNSKFHGENFSTRIWGRTDRLADELQAKLAFAVAKGQSWEKTSREIRERFGASQSSAERLIRTETNYFENSAEIEAYDELGVKEFEFLAALDGRTSEICRHHHGKRFKLKDAKAGVNTPPLHPNCRSTVVAVIPELERDSEVTDIDVGKRALQSERIIAEEDGGYSPRDFNSTTRKTGVTDYSKLPHTPRLYERKRTEVL